MRSVNGWPIGVCSWSLHDDVDAIQSLLKQQALSHLHLHVAALEGPGGDRLRGLIAREGWTVTCTMVGFPQEDYSTLERIRLTGGVVPEADWPANKDRLVQAIATTSALGVPYLSLHAGFLNHTDPAYAATFEGRIREVAEVAAEQGVTILLETGQERAADLRDFMQALNHPALGINFDPANMILYDKDDPLDAVRILSPWIRHVHIKDATRTRTPGTWGVEVPWGDGEVQANAFLGALAEAGYNGALAIEREAGDSRVVDIGKAIERLTHD
ncbi:MAG: sugar phosphate isomerase/epimerase [Verrucomicrobia bacterium]|jgi:L-ribulose-5-phosphate 3-epimerase|nr:sugar phosphate isomerase/epimerase [Verrucomicrobiota bacterium]MBT7700908.1 sugar phosphate isomerase/epimerase [Verrucomicrobiota bacterium]